jgi:hypothetical protein
MRAPLLTAAALALSVGTSSAEVRLSMQAGQVSISAKNATVAQILAEWARVGQTRIVNGERLAGAPLTIELTNVSEREALEVLLRNASGYVLAPRSAAAGTGSMYDRILIVPTSSAPRAAAPAPVATPAFRPAFQPVRPGGDDADADEAAPTVVPRFVAPVPGDGNAPAPGQPAAPPPSSRPTAPVGVARPGMMVPTPPAPPQREAQTARPD